MDLTHLSKELLRWRVPRRPSPGDDQPLRGELMSLEQLERHAKALATAAKVDTRGGPNRLLARLRENEAELLHTYELVSQAVVANKKISPAGEWLLDNYYLIEEQVRTARRHLPRGYSRELPRLVSGPHAGFPRVYAIALELITHVDGLVDAISLGRFVAAYQSVQPLRLGELWAVPIMLRLALIENMRRVAVRTSAARHDRNRAVHWAERMIETAEQRPTALILEVADMARAGGELTCAFVAEFTRCVQGQSPSLSLAVNWIESRLAEHQQTIEQLIQAESQFQAADQVSIGYSIGSLRNLSALDWREFVETMSVVEITLRGDPADVYSDMGFATRDRYRHVVERIARRSPMDEQQVAEAAVRLAKAAIGAGGERPPTAHVGWYLVERGRRELERAVAMRVPLGEWPGRLAARHPLALYLGLILLLTAAGTASALAWMLYSGAAWASGWWLALVAVPVALGASQLAVTVVNWAATLLATPEPLPRLELPDGVPPEYRTLVVVPTMLTDRASFDDLLERLEVRHLANRDRCLHFALLTDFTDAPHEQLPGDEALLAHARRGIERLNAKYSGGAEMGGEDSGAYHIPLGDGLAGDQDDQRRADIFHLLHRPRRWNASARCWMGWERKRGKIADLNRFLLSGRREVFQAVVGVSDVLARVRYVITLDSDTQLPRDSARELIGTMAHTLNRPRFDERRRLVVEGHAILQPRVAISLPSAHRSWFSRLAAGDPGIDPYTRAVSDLYQDVFHEGSFVGKGIYDLAAFERALENRFPENRILSHDLVEGCHARAGLVSDVQLYEDHPSRYLADAVRRHRWIRGDWQIARWLLPWVPGGDGRATRNPLSLLSRWKILDNLRRSLVPPAFLVLFLGAWLALPGQAAGWTAVVLAAFAGPALLPVLREALAKSHEISWLSHLRNVGTTAGRQLLDSALRLAFLPYEAVLSADAVLRTLGRLLVTHRRLLEWKTASDAERESHGLLGHLRAMWPAPVIALAVAAALVAGPGLPALWPALPLLAAWGLSPWIAWLISQPRIQRAHRLDAGQQRFLLRAARRTWRFFQTFVVRDDHWLPPDNYQEQPVAVVAHRTSPTNIGVALLANLSAYDFGWSSLRTLVERCDRTLVTLERMERHRGHFYNWYDTRTLRPLLPLYVSTVDSGNLAAHLLTLRGGLLGLVSAPVVSPRIAHGLRTTLDLLRLALCPAEQAAGAARDPAAPGLAGAQAEQLAARIDALDRELAVAPGGLDAVWALLERALAVAEELSAAVAASQDQDLRWWCHAFAQECQDHRDELAFLAPWLAIPGRPRVEDAAAVDGPLALARRLERPLTLAEIAGLAHEVLPGLERAAERADLPPALRDWCRAAVPAVRVASNHAGALITSLQGLAQQANELGDMEFGFLYDRSRDLFTIGYNATDRRLDNSFYDLLASEARLTSYLAIAQGQLEQEHWFALGRLLTTSKDRRCLLSWSGSMFEYLMPLLVMPTYPGTLLDETYHAAVQRQIAYAREHGVPWGISESAYNLTDLHLNYQYRAFGVPGLGLKRGLGDDLVIAPYASALALMVAPEAACANLQRLDEEGRQGPYGFYEAIDYTQSRLPRGNTSVTVRSWMAHHQGMSLLAFAYLLLDRPMQRRFASDPLFKAIDLLLHERVPRRLEPVHPHAAEVSGPRHQGGDAEGTMRVFSSPSGALPEVHLLSNGRYHVMVSAGGGGYSRWRDLAVTRWREDPTREGHGVFCYLRDVEHDEVWSTAYQPTQRTGKHYQAIFTQARAEFRRQDLDIDSHTEIAVSPEDDIELRRVTLSNRSKTARTIEITSYGEVVIAPPAADTAHSAFSNLFVQTRLVRERGAILATRRARSQGETPPWLLHRMTVHGEEIGTPSFSTDRSAFIGRGRSSGDPQALDHGARLDDSQGSVLDPIVAVRRTLRLEPDGVAVVDLVVGMAETEAAASALIEKYGERRLADRVFELAWTHSQVVLRHLNASEANAQVFGRLAGSVILPTHHRRAAPSVLAKNRRGQSALWGFGISGDLPIVLVRSTDAGKFELVRQAVQAHAYWRAKGLVVDLVILNEDSSVYRQQLYDQIMGVIAAGAEAQLVDKPGGIFVRRGDQLTEDDRVLLQCVARVVLIDTAGSLAEQVERRPRPEAGMPRLALPRLRRPLIPTPEPRRDDLVFTNGLGGFTQDGREYVVVLKGRATTPAPWCNVLANPHFGTVVSESGAVYSWLENCHEFRLTPWYNDPVSDPSGEAMYIRDEEHGHYWSPTPAPARSGDPYVVRHGFGYSVWEHVHDGVACELWTWVAVDAPVKFTTLKLRNLGPQARRLSVTGYWEWVLGELRHKSGMHLITEIDQKSGALLARNPYSPEFPNRMAFVDVHEPGTTFTGDRSEFVGRGGSLARPAAMGRTRLSGRVGAGYDSCAALQVPFELHPGQERELVFMLGVGADADDVQRLLQRFRGTAGARTALEAVWAHWNRTLGAVHVETPDAGLNMLANGWLIYQTIACRLWARTGFYQSGGAFGFRDQLQDGMALVHAAPGLAREHLLRAAAHQFNEGDVQHWWHPPSGRGVRTHFSDDYLWLPYACARHVATTGDTGVLDEQVPFITGRPVNADEEAYYDLPQRSDGSESLYVHCKRAIERGLRFGDHGLPLIGCGDWNDGMNRVGEHGKGESVWLGFFLHDVLVRFAGIARARADLPFAEHCAAQAGQLIEHLEAQAWDGGWYRRAYFDDGTPLGSAGNEECQIDSLPQSWSVLSRAGDPARARMAMQAVDRRLVDRQARLVKLFDPPFDRSTLNPGYIKGYVPGVRENGGQYTHAAIWTVMAFAALGDRERAWELFQMISPVNHGASPAHIATYKVEPYVVAADVYAVPPHTGRGGWTWYTGSAGWMYRLIVESLLGVRLEDACLRIVPCVPAGWTGYTVHYRWHNTLYHIVVRLEAGASNRIIVDGQESPDQRIVLVDDGGHHRAEVVLDPGTVL